MLTGFAFERAAMRDARATCERIEYGHDVGAPAKGADGEAAADDLAQRGQVRLVPEVLLRPVIVHAERDDLVRDEQHVVLARDPTQTCQEVVNRVQKAGAVRQWVDDDGREFGCVLHHEMLDRVRVVER